MKPAMRSIVIGTALALGVMAAPRAQVSIGISTPNISIGINVPTYPTMTVIPGYPVYYAPQVDANYFFYDGLYWVFANDNWYSSYWYNGPWTLVAPVYVPVYVLRVPVRYYRVVPVYFRGWHSEAPPRWGDRWGRDWEQRRGGWDRWDRGAAPRPAPLPTYQRQYAGERYPRRDQQVVLRDQNYRYQPRDNLVREQVDKERLQRGHSPQARNASPGQQRHDESRPAPASYPQPSIQPPARNGGPPREAVGGPPDRKDDHRDAQQRDAQQRDARQRDSQQRDMQQRDMQQRDMQAERQRDAQRDAQREPPGQARRESPAPYSAPPPQQHVQRSAPDPQPQPQPKVQHGNPPLQQPKVQHGDPPLQQAQGRGVEQPREQRADGRGGGRPDTPNAAPNQGGKAPSQDRGAGGGGKDYSGQDRGKAGDDNGKK